MHIACATEWSHEAIADCFTAAFEGYIAGSMPLSADTLPRFLARQGADLALSHGVVHEGTLAGLAFIGEYAQRRRIGGMGLRPQARGTGASRQLLSRVIDDARRDGIAAVELEVFVQNAPAVALYRSAGFIDGPLLWGFTRQPAPVAEAEPASPDIVTAVQAADWLLEHGRSNLPYQSSGHALRHADHATTFWRLGAALMGFNEPVPGRLAILLLFDANPSQRDARRLLRALLRRHPAHEIRVPQLMRDDCAAVALRQAGFVQSDLYQMQMRLPI